MKDVVEPRVETLAHRGVAPAGVVIAQTRRGAVIALDSATGEPLWRCVTHDRATQVAYGDGRVYMSVATTDRPASVEVDTPPRWQRMMEQPARPLTRTPRIKARPSAVTALRALDGATLWRVTLYSADIVGPVYLAGDALITSVISFASQAREIIALDAETGTLRWSQRIGPLFAAFSHHTPRLLWVDGGTIAGATVADTGATKAENPSFALLDSATGVIIWRSDQAPPDPATERRSAAGALTISIDHGPAWPHEYVRALRASDGAEVWRVACEGVAGLPTTPVDMFAHDERVYLLSQSAYRVRLHALDAATGRILWRWRSTSVLFALFLLRQAIQRTQEARRMGTWRSLWRDAFHLRWRHPVRPEGVPTMTVARGEVYLATYLGAFALRARDGRRRWHALPFVVVSRLRVGSEDAGE
jgi:outer membrane protein assembly factor BamB